MITLNHTIVFSREKTTAATFLTDILRLAARKASREVYGGGVSQRCHTGLLGHQ